MAFMVFIPKPKKNQTQTKSLRPISLMSFMLKTMEKVIDRHIKEDWLKEQYIRPNNDKSFMSKIKDYIRSIPSYRGCV